jgi:tetratricopeptide (TPR) repeat protein
VLAHYRLPAVPGLLLAAVAAARALVGLARKRAWPALAGGLGALAAAAVLALAPKLEIPFDQGYFKLGYAYQVQGQLDAAERSYEQALLSNPGYLSALNNLAMLSEKRGNRERAQLLWHELYRQASQTGEQVYVDAARQHIDAPGR